MKRRLLLFAVLSLLILELTGFDPRQPPSPSNCEKIPYQKMSIEVEKRFCESLKENLQSKWECIGAKGGWINPLDSDEFATLIFLVRKEAL